MNLKKVIFDIFGDMFFLFPEEYDEDELQGVQFPTDWIKYKVAVEKGDAFVINCYFTPAQARQMTENFLGVSADEISPDVLDGALQEAVNVIGGNLLNTLETEYSLGIPEACPADDAQQLKNRFDPDTAILLNVEDEPFLAVISR